VAAGGVRMAAMLGSSDGLKCIAALILGEADRSLRRVSHRGLDLIHLMGKVVTPPGVFQALEQEATMLKEALTLQAALEKHLETGATVAERVLADLAGVLRARCARAASSIERLMAESTFERAHKAVRTLLDAVREEMKGAAQALVKDGTESVKGKADALKTLLYESPEDTHMQWEALSEGMTGNDWSHFKEVVEKFLLTMEEEAIQGARMALKTELEKRRATCLSHSVAEDVDFVEACQALVDKAHLAETTARLHRILVSGASRAALRGQVVSAMNEARSEGLNPERLHPALQTRRFEAAKRCQ